MEASLPTKLDYFFIAAGADYRAYENSRLLNTLNCKIENLVVYDFPERQQPNDAIYTKKYDRYHDIKAENIIEISTSITNPTDCIPSLNRSEVDIHTSLKIGLDISCFTKPFFYVLLNYFSHIKMDQIFIFYTQPVSYRFAEENYRSFRSSSGPISVKEVPSFPGRDTRNNERILVVILGFDGDLSSEINEIVAPTKTFVFNGFPGFEPKFKDISLINNEKLVNHSQTLYSRSSNPFEIYNHLENLKTNSNITSLSIAPLGNKPMALGACLFAIHNPFVRVVYPFPKKYEKIISDDCSISWVYTIPLQPQPVLC